MVFSSITFLTVFLPFTVVLYYLPHAFSASARNGEAFKTYKNIVLCVASLIFYAWGEPKNIILMLLSIVFNYIVALHMEKKFQKGEGVKALLVFALIFDLGLLAFFKYSGFVADNLSLIPGIDLTAFNDPALPIGISFYTFQILSYVIDVYTKKVSVQKSILDFALYISMFPQLIAGPIVQYSVIDRQLSERHESFESTAVGISVFIKGLAKKTILANTAGAVFQSLTSPGLEDISMLGAWGAAVFYAFQIYFDFGGYSDMAKGLGGMFGFTFPDNFNHPYVAVNVTDFWRRWHITLSAWFRDYVYIPLGGNRCSKARHIFNLFVVWSLTGLWHGASWNFVLWGVYYFVLLVAEKYLFGNIIKKLPAFMTRAVTFMFVLVGWVLFAFTDIKEILLVFKGMLGFNSFSDPASVYIVCCNIVILAVMALCSTELFSGKSEEKSDKLSFCLKALWSAILLILSVICLIGDTYNPFLYFRF